MKINTFISALTLAVLGLFAACNNFTGKPDHAQPQHIAALDTLWTSTGNAQLDSL